MPAPGAQHRNDPAQNPFEEPKKRVSEFTAQEIATLQSRLDQKLGPEYLSSRPGPGNKKVHYITAEKVIQLANEIFGFNGWSSSIQNVQVDFVEENSHKGTVSMGLSVIVRVTLRDGTYHEDIGYGSIDNCKGKAMAFEKAKKEGTTDALKRALRSFGNVLGNCIYDKTYLTNITKIKVQSTKFDEDKLYRHADFIKKEPAQQPLQPPAAATNSKALAQSKEEQTLPALPLETAEDLDFLVELDDADFCVSEPGHPDEVDISIADTISSNASNNNQPPPQNQYPPPQIQPQSRPPARSSLVTNNLQPHTPRIGGSGKPEPLSALSNGQQGHIINGRPQPAAIHQPHNAESAPAQTSTAYNRPMHNPQSPHNNPPTQAVGEVGFFSAKGIADISEGKEPSLIANAPRFDPKHESPSIRKTPGIDHNSSKPVSRNGTHVPPASQSNSSSKGGAQTGGFSGSSRPGGFNGGGGFKAPTPRYPQPTNVVNPQMNQARQIGVPGGASPLANRGQYRPPMKRPVPGEQGSGTVGRQALDDVSNVAHGTNGTVSGPDIKRTKVG